MLLGDGNEIELVEIKSAQAIASDAMRAVMNVRRALGDRVRGCTLIYGGDEVQQRTELTARPVESIRAWLEDIQ
jgi:hypothetical protein